MDIHVFFDTYWQYWSGGRVTSLECKVRAPTRLLLARRGTSSTPPVTLRIVASGVGFFSPTFAESVFWTFSITPSSESSLGTIFWTLSPLDNRLTNLPFFGLRFPLPFPLLFVSFTSFSTTLFFRSGLLPLDCLISGNFSTFEGLIFSLSATSLPLCSLVSSSLFTWGKVSEDLL